MLSQREPDKARRYLDLLDAARCDGHWEEIPELTRKVGKHAPQRNCLTLTAQTERRITEVSGRSITSSSASALSQLVPPLQAATEKERTFNEDVFQAQICLGWIHSTIGDHSQALLSLPPTFDRVSDRLSRDGGITARWTQVCIVKGAYLRGISLEETNGLEEAIRTYESMLPYITSLPSTISSTQEQRYWTECLLTRHCMLSSRHVSTNQVSPSITVAPPSRVLAPFRAYSKYWDTKGASNAGVIPKPSNGQSSYIRTWACYYDTLSVLLQRETMDHVFDSRLQQGTELKKVEATYENILLKETNFPRADQTNSHIESWVDQVMANWRVMCGHTWQEADLGEGGKASLGRGVLSILYRAATKTFHSTKILRHLFTVHAAIAEFDVGTEALNSYLHILNKVKARVEKSGEPEIGLDDEETSLATAAAGISVLCDYGGRKEAERALAITHTVESWLQKLHPGSPPKPVISAEDVPEDLVDQRKMAKPPVPGKALALGYHALGIGQCRWAQLTYKTTSRPDLQAKAVANFRTALDPAFGESHNIDFLYSLAFVSAETRDIDDAIAAAKQALSVSRGPSTNGVSTTDFAGDSTEDGSETAPDRRGSLLKCWHLLALLLSARQNFSTAIASCEAALEMYGGKAILYGDVKLLDSLNDLQWSERKNIIEVKMTQLALVEVVDGPEEAVNASEELLGLFAKLFKTPEKSLERAISPPSNTNGTSTPRSFRASILGLGSRKGTGRPENAPSGSLTPSEAPEHPVEAPNISVTSDTTSKVPDANHHSHLPDRVGSNKLHKRNSRKSVSSNQRSRATSPLRVSTSDGSRKRTSFGLPTRHRHNEFTPAEGPGDGSVYESGSYASDEVGVAISHNLPSMPSSPVATSDPLNPLHTIPSTTANMDKRNPNTYPVAPKPPPSRRQRPQPIALHKFAPLAEPHFSPADRTRHILTLLTKIWLLIASLYRRASIPTDAQGALSEATIHVQSIETTISKREGSSAAKFATPGHGGIKSCGELWADVLAEQAALYTALGDVDQASSTYETALGHFPDHAAATIGLCNILLDTYSAPPPRPPPPNTISQPSSTPILASLPLPPSQPQPQPQSRTTTNPNPNPDTTPSHLSKLAARDRAYGLLSALTKSGNGWDDSEAWFALARAYEESGMPAKAEEALWWVVELEEGRGVRGWGNIV